MMQYSYVSALFSFILHFIILYHADAALNIVVCLSVCHIRRIAVTYYHCIVTF